MNSFMLPWGDKYPNTEIVGEQHYKPAILKVAGKPSMVDDPQNFDTRVLLVPEPDNPHDPLAISVRTETNEMSALRRTRSSAIWTRRLPAQSTPHSPVMWPPN